MLLASMAFLLTAHWLTAARPAFACSCVQPQPMAAYGTGDYAVFSGTTGPSDARGVPVRIARWFSGPGPAPVIYLAASSFGDSAACGTQLPRAGTDWIWVASIQAGGDPLTGLCDPHGQIGTQEGDALFADAVTAYGGVAVPDPPPAATASSSASATDPPGAPAPATPSGDGVAILLGTIGLGLVVLLGAVVIARGRTERRGHE
jgi:hypothetical protein